MTMIIMAVIGQVRRKGKEQKYWTFARGQSADAVGVYGERVRL